MEPIEEKSEKEKKETRQQKYRRQLEEGKITQEEFTRLYMSRGKERRQLNRIRIRDNNICYLCWKYVPLNEGSREHIIGLWEGGTNDDDNVVLAHAECNVLKNEYELIKQIEQGFRENRWGKQ